MMTSHLVSSLILTGLLLTTAWCQCGVDPRLNHPCGGVDLSRSRCTKSCSTYQSLGNAVVHAIRAAEALRTMYYDPSSMHTRLNDGVLTGINHTHCWNSSQEFNDIDNPINMHYEIIATIAKMVNVAQGNETSVPFKNKMTRLRKKLQRVLCKLSKLRDFQASRSLISSVSSPLNDSFCDRRNSARRHQRDYIVFRDSVSYLNATLNYYRSTRASR